MARQRGEAAAEQGDDDGVDQEQRQRRGERQAAQVARLGAAISGLARVECRDVERRQRVVARQRVDGERAIGGAVEAGRMIGRGAAAKIDAKRLGGRRRRGEGAETIERARGRDRFRLSARCRPRRRLPLRWCRPCPPPAAAFRRRCRTSAGFDQRMSALTWNSASTPLPRRSPVTSGVPSASEAQLRSASSASGSASTCRVTVTSPGTCRPANGPSAANAASCCGFSQVRLPPRLRSPSRSLTGDSPSSACASRGPAKRTSTPPLSIQAPSRARRSGVSAPTSARTIIGSLSLRNCATACAGAARSARRMSANGDSARVR